MPKQSRTKYLDILRAIAIILVIIGHMPSSILPSGLHKWLYSFSIPLFFFVSGASMSFTDYKNLNILQHFKKRFLRIYVPYLFWGLILALSNFSLESVLKIVYGTHQSIAAVSNSSLWFLPVLFFSTIILDIIFYLLYKKTSHPNTYLIAIFLLLLSITPLIPTDLSIGGHILPFGLNVVPMAICFLLFGFLFQTIVKIEERKKPLILFLFLMVAFFAITTWGSLNNNINYVLMAEGRYGDYLFFFISAFSGIIASISLSIILAHSKIRLATPIQLIGTNTMIIFILHKYIILLLSDIFTITTIQIQNLFLILIYLASSLTICLFLSLFFKKYAPILAGK